ncbi:MAG: transcription-repair coupling factor, partial [Quisquiliibacterium sp.]
MPRRGTSFALPSLAGSSDSLLIATLASQLQSTPSADSEDDLVQTRSRTLAVFTANAPDAQRLSEEVAFFAPELQIRLLPDWETLPYDNFSPHQDLISERLDTLFSLHQQRCDLLITAATTALHRFAPPSFLASHTFFFDKGQRLDEAALRAQLTVAGYEHVSQVIKPGEYSVRGGLIDLFPMGSPLPYRIDLFGDEIDSIRTFDPDSQRSLYPIDTVRLLPGREFPLDEAARTG